MSITNPRLRTFQALSHRNYRLYVSGQIVSQSGTWMQTLGQQWLVLSLTNSPLWLGIVGFCSSVPVLLFSMVGGVVADRVNKRHMLIVTQSAAAVQALTLAVLTATGRVQVWHVMLAALALGTINAFDTPTRQAFVVEMVGKEDLANAIALNSSVFNGARIVGPSLAGILVAIPQIGPAGAFLINALSFLAVIISLLLMEHTYRPNTVKVQSLRANVLEGLAYVRSNRTLTTLVLTNITTTVFGMSYSTMLPVFARDILRVGAQGQGLMMTCVGVGALGGALTLATLAGLRRKGIIWSVGNLLFPPMLMVLAVSRFFPLTLAGLLLQGFAMIVQNATTNTLMQTTAPDHLRGRVMGIHILTMQGMMPLGSLQVGIVANALGAPVAVALGAAICMAMAVTVFVRVPEIRSLA